MTDKPVRPELTNLDVTLTLAEYVRRMTSADAAEWLPTPSETRVMSTFFRIVDIEGDGDPYYTITLSDGVKHTATGDHRVTVSLIPY